MSGRHSLQRPPLRVLGYLRLKGRPPGALLALGEQRQVVKAGQRLRLSHEGRSLDFEVTRLDETGLTLQSPAGDRWELR